MKKAIIGRKAGMSQIFDGEGRIIPVTIIQAGPCEVAQVKTVEKDGYAAVQLAFGEVRKNKVTQPMAGHYKKAGLDPRKTLREFKLEGSELKVGDVVKADVFAPGEQVDVTGVSKGKGYAGVIKRHGAHRTPESHGGGPVHRHQGSMGSGTDPGRVFPGKKMAGHLGVEQMTILNLEVVKVDPELNMIAVRGAVPGPKGGLVTVRNTVKNNV
ncbi:MAG: 50S ribosomal protein L3 [Oscillospiraceae bacterium]|nr:50S ribosomal protein L3 [Oscillospiraceae bacterium]